MASSLFSLEGKDGQMVKVTTTSRGLSPVAVGGGTDDDGETKTKTAAAKNGNNNNHRRTEQEEQEAASLLHNNTLHGAISNKAALAYLGRINNSENASSSFPFARLESLSPLQDHQLQKQATARACPLCEQEFGVLLRRSKYNCYFCGIVVCNGCSLQTFAGRRQCDACNALVSEVEVDISSCSAEIISARAMSRNPKSKEEGDGGKDDCFASLYVRLVLTNKKKKVPVLDMFPTSSLLSSSSYDDAAHDGDFYTNSSSICWGRHQRLGDMIIGVDLSDLGINKVDAVGDHFLRGCRNLKTLDLSPIKNVSHVGDFFLADCHQLNQVQIRFFPSSSPPVVIFFGNNLKSVGSRFMHCAAGSARQNNTNDDDDDDDKDTTLSWQGQFLLESSTTTTASNNDNNNNNNSPLEKIGGNFMCGASKRLVSFNLARLANVTQIGEHFLTNCTRLTRISSFDALTKLETIGECFLWNAQSLTHLQVGSNSSLKNIGDWFCWQCVNLKFVF